MTVEEKLHRTAMSFGAWRERANKTKHMNDRIKFVHAENALERAAQTYYEEMKKRSSRGKRKRIKS